MEVSNFQSEGGIYVRSEMESSPPFLEPDSVERIPTRENQGDTDSSFTASAHPDEDWTKVSDLAERRRIQNRIAQRNYRKKIKERMADLERRVGAGEKVKSPKSTQKAQRQKDAKEDTEREYDSPPAANKLPPPHAAHIERESSSPVFSWDEFSFPTPSTAAPSQDPQFPPMHGIPASKDDLDFQHLSQADFSNSLGEHAKANDKSRQSDSGAAELVPPPSILHPMLPHSAGPNRTQKHAATFRCTICMKRFTRAYNLRSHLRTHTNEKPFEDHSSDYESNDAGYVSGTEAGFGETNDQPQESSFRGRRRAVDDNRLLLPHPKQKKGDMVPRAGFKTFSQTPHDRPPATDTGGINLGRSSSVEQSLGLGTRRIQSQLDPHESKQQDVTDPEVPIEEYSDTGDDNMSLRSFAESVFDIGSVLSSASSSYSNSHALVASFVDILLHDPNMDRLLAITTSEFGVSSGRFTRNVGKILKSYSRHLRRAVEGLRLSKDVRDNYLTAAKAVYSSRHQISNLIASRYNERAPTAQDLQHRQVDIISRHLDQLVQIDNDQSSSNEESGVDEADFTTIDVKQFLVSGEPFWLLKRNLRSLVIPDEFLDCIYESARAFLELLLTERRIRSAVHGLRHALHFGRDIQSNLSMQIRIMAAELRRECTDIAQLDASIFLETYSEYISAIAIDYIDTTFTSSGRSVPGSTQMQDKVAPNIFIIQRSIGSQGHYSRSPLPHEDILEQIVAETLPSVLYVDLAPHWTFMASSGAFFSFMDALHDLAYPTFFSKAKEFVRATIQSSQEREDQLALEGLRLLPILAEMESCRLNGDNLIHFSMDPSEYRVSALDWVKIWIEASTAAEWDWWPMQPPKRPRSQDRAELSWQCSCGAIRQESILATYANELQSIFNNFPLSRPGSSGPLDRPPSSLSHTSSQEAKSTVSTGSSSTNYSGKQSASSSSSSPNSAITPPDDGDDSVVDFSNGPRRYIYVFLLVKASEYILETIDVSSMTARDFFQTLKTTYKKHRSLWRRAFSVFVYNHCDFIKIIKPEPDTFIPGDLKFELPPDHDDEYYYRPRPTYSAPVTRHMFRHYFYGCYESDSLRHRLHTCLPLAPKCRIRNPAGEILDFFPKRDRPVAIASQSEKVEVCYGIEARECRSFFRVVVYLCLIMAPAFWFVFAWLFMWGDRGDLQDATIPMTLVLSMLSILWAVVHSGSDVRKDYGDGSN